MEKFELSPKVFSVAGFAHVVVVLLLSGLIEAFSLAEYHRGTAMAFGHFASIEAILAIAFSRGRVWRPSALEYLCVSVSNLCVSVVLGLALGVLGSYPLGWIVVVVVSFYTPLISLCGGAWFRRARIERLREQRSQPGEPE